MPPFFYQSQLPQEKGLLTLTEDNSKHCIQVLRMKTGQKLIVTDGNGNLIEAVIVMPHKKNCVVNILSVRKIKREANRKFSLAIGLTKRKMRNEWLLEKATEIGLQDVFPVISANSERKKFNEKRFKKVMTAAMLQSQQAHLPLLHATKHFEDFLFELSNTPKEQRFIAHCGKKRYNRKSLLSQLKKDHHCLILIGPEGDFNETEIQQALSTGFIPVHLGRNRLRTETAALYAGMVYNAFQDEED